MRRGGGEARRSRGAEEKSSCEKELRRRAKELRGAMLSTMMKTPETLE
jgi:hypothetical protein